MSQYSEVEIIEVTDHVQERPEANPSDADLSQEESVKPVTTSQQAEPQGATNDMVPIEDLVTVFVDGMTSLVERMIHTSQNITRKLMSAIDSMTHR